MPLEDMLFKFLIAAVSVLGSGLIGTLAWVALGVIRRLDNMRAADEAQHAAIRSEAAAQFTAFGRQLASLHDLFTEDIHRHDVRIVRLEEWRRGIDRAPHAHVNPHGDHHDD